MQCPAGVVSAHLPLPELPHTLQLVHVPGPKLCFIDPRRSIVWLVHSTPKSEIRLTTYMIITWKIECLDFERFRNGNNFDPTFDIQYVNPSIFRCNFRWARMFLIWYSISRYYDTTILKNIYSIRKNRFDWISIVQFFHIRCTISSTRESFDLISDTLYSIYDIWYSIFDIRYLILDIRYTIFYIRSSIYDMRYSILDIRYELLDDCCLKTA